MQRAAPQTGPLIDPAALPRQASGVLRRRLFAGWGLALMGLPALTMAMVALPAAATTESVLVYLLAVVVVAAVGHKPARLRRRVAYEMLPGGALMRRKSRRCALFRHPSQAVVTAFAAAVPVGTLLLTLPAARAREGAAPFVNALFTATSAVCVTGLNTVDTRTCWPGFGQSVILDLRDLERFSEQG